MDNCPFCGAEIDEGYTYLKTYKCGAFHRDNKVWRSRPECYEAQLAQQSLSLKSYVEHHEAQTKDLNDTIAKQAELLRRAEEIIREVDLTPTYDGRGECCFCGKRAGAGHDKDCERLKARTLLPELEKALEKT